MTVQDQSRDVFGKKPMKEVSQMPYLLGLFRHPLPGQSACPSQGNCKHDVFCASPSVRFLACSVHKRLYTHTSPHEEGSYAFRRIHLVACYSEKVHIQF